MAVVEVYAVRPLIGQWLNDCGTLWWMMKEEMNLFWSMAERPMLLLLTPLLGCVWVLAFVVLYLLRLVMRYRLQNS